MKKVRNIIAQSNIIIRGNILLLYTHKEDKTYRFDTINKHISKKRHIKTLQNLLNAKIEYHFTFFNKIILNLLRV